MKVDKIGKLCRRTGCCQLISIGHSDTKEEQFISTGHSVYPLPPDFPKITSEAELAAVFGWDSKKQKEVTLSTEYYSAKDDMAEVSLYDSKNGELECTELPMGVIYGKMNCIGLTDTMGGCGFINAMLTEPLKDEMKDDSYFHYTKRKAGANHYYYVLKDGMDLRAVILPTIFKDRFFQDLDEFYAAVSDMREKK